MGRRKGSKNKNKQQHLSIVRQQQDMWQEPIATAYVAIQAEADFVEHGMCAICESQQGFKKLKDVDDEAHSLAGLFLAEILQCEHCGGVNISVAYPPMDGETPIYLDWDILKVVKPAEDEHEEGTSNAMVPPEPHRI